MNEAPFPSTSVLTVRYWRSSMPVGTQIIVTYVVNIAAPNAGLSIEASSGEGWEAAEQALLPQMPEFLKKVRGGA
jgi:hypothetical protein